VRCPGFTAYLIIKVDIIQSSFLSCRAQYFTTYLSVYQWILPLMSVAGSRDSSVGIAMGWSLSVRFMATSRPVPGPTQLPIQWVLVSLSPGVMEAGT
jgi:hypothetical protein